MKSKKKKTNKDRDSGIIWCMAEIYAMKLAIKALQSQINELTPPQNPEQS
tara:strand:+ start:807 stop:956 length:150 start_codon:yes stop_codon:yes gene_type:complete